MSVSDVLASLRRVGRALGGIGKTVSSQLRHYISVMVAPWSEKLWRPRHRHPRHERSNDQALQRWGVKGSALERAWESMGIGMGLN